MNKKFTIVLAFTLGLAFNLLAQTIVGTEPENKNVVLEEFTGIHCGYCPLGHAAAQAIYDNNPEDAVIIAIHQGGYASPGAGEPDFRTEFGNAIAGQTGLTGYPSGTVNRHIFSGSNTAMGTSQWAGAATNILGQASYLNIACEATIVPETGQCTILVEIYYTGDSPEPTNLLNVAILQNNIIGYQSDYANGETWDYNHKHMLRDLITGQWGTEISETSEGSFYTTTLTYNLPEDYNDIDVVIEDIDIVAFVSETHQEIISGCMAEITYPAASEYDVSMQEITFPGEAACYGFLAPRFILKNWGSEPLTSVDIDYSINDGTIATYSWTGNLVYPGTTEILLPAISYTGEANNTLEIVVGDPNGMTDTNPANNSGSKSFETGMETTKNISMELYVGYVFSNQVSWKLIDCNGEVVEEGGDYGGGTTVEKTWALHGNNCYTFFLMDSGENGYGGYCKLSDDNGEFINITDELVDVVEVTFHTDSNVGVGELSTSSVSIYPNPSKNTTNISYSLAETSLVSVDVYSITGAQVIETAAIKQTIGHQKMTINTSSLEEGIYFVSLTINDQVITKKITVIK